MPTDTHPCDVVSASPEAPFPDFESHTKSEMARRTSSADFYTYHQAFCLQMDPVLSHPKLRLFLAARRTQDYRALFLPLGLGVV